jgi:tRNA G46 methylase TrmB
MESRFFVCNHIILSFHEMVTCLQINFPDMWTKHKKELIYLYQDEQGKALEYYLLKYPQKGKVFLSSDLKNLAKEINNLSDPKYHMISRLQITIDPIVNDRGELNYDMDVSKIDYSRKIKLLINALITEAKKWNEEFKKTMQSIFTLTSSNFKDEPKMLEDIKMSMKFRENVEIYTD